MQFLEIVEIVMVKLFFHVSHIFCVFVHAFFLTSQLHIFSDKHDIDEYPDQELNEKALDIHPP